MLCACTEVRVEPGREGDDTGGEPRRIVDPSAPADSSPRAPRGCQAAIPIVEESFARPSWPSAWLPAGEGKSWVDDNAGYLLASVGESHARTLYAPFGDIDVAVRWVPSGDQSFQLKLRGDVENKDATIVEGHAVGNPLRRQWLRARIWSELGTTRVEVHEWFDGDPEPEGWLASVAGPTGPVGTFSLMATEHGGQVPIRVEEVVVCPLVVGTEV